MKLFYAVGFNTAGTAGKSRATRQKSDALSSLIENYSFFSLGKKNVSPFCVIKLELRVLKAIFKCRPDVLVTRGYVGFMSVFICRFLDIKFVREVHADAIEESALLSKNKFKRLILKLVAKFFLFLDKNANAIIYNHPVLEQAYNERYGLKQPSISVYNGYSPRSKPSGNVDLYKKKYGLPLNKLIFSFVGSATEWHGIDYIVDLETKLSGISNDFAVVCAGGDISKFVTEGSKIINITPLDSAGCDELIYCSDVCLLPVKQNRVSPGSPLKLYDYIFFNKFVIAPSDLLGYSDEVKLYGNGLTLDFATPDLAAKNIVDFFSSYPLNPNTEFDTTKFTWVERMKVWVAFLSA